MNIHGNKMKNGMVIGWKWNVNWMELEWNGMIMECKWNGDWKITEWWQNGNKLSIIMEHKQNGDGMVMELETK